MGRNLLEAGLHSLEQGRLVVLDREQEVPVGIEDHLGQGPLGEQGVGGAEIIFR